MYRQVLSFIGMPAIAVAGLAWAAEPVLAQHGRGGGGSRGGGAVGHVSGGARPGGFRGGASAALHGGGRPAAAAATIRHYAAGGHGFGHAAFGPAAFRAGARAGFYGGRGYYGGDGGYPILGGGWFGGYYGGGAFDNAYYFGPSVDLSAANAPPVFNYSYYFGDAGGTATYNPGALAVATPPGDTQALPPPEKPATDPNAATLIVRVPPDAEIWFDGTKMTLTGPERHYVTPPLPPDQDYAYMVRARWTVNGRVVDQTHKVTFRPGQSILVDFLTPPPAAGDQPAAP